MVVGTERRAEGDRFAVAVTRLAVDQPQGLLESPGPRALQIRALQPVHRLELRGLLSSEWGLSDNNRRAKFYKLTAAGRQHLSTQSDSWSRLAAAVTQVLNAT